MARTVADQFAEVLAAAGVNRIYGIVGGCLNGLTESLPRQGMIEWIHVRFEEVAAFVAKGFKPYMVKSNLSDRGDEVVDLARTNLTTGKLS